MICPNSAQLQVVEVYPGARPLPAHAVKDPPRPGEAFESDGSMNDAGVDRVAAAVARAMVAVPRLSVEQLFAFTTSAVRDVTNRDLILAPIEEAAGIKLQFLSGDVAYLAAHRWYGWSAGRLLAPDIGFRKGIMVHHLQSCRDQTWAPPSQSVCSAHREGTSATVHRLPSTRGDRMSELLAWRVEPWSG
jgi:hypothetical protein